MENKTLNEDNEEAVQTKEKNKYFETTNAWKQKNKDKLALYARNYYNKRTSNDPTYKALLCEKKKSQILKNKNKNEEDIKKRGRPRKYPL